MDRLLIGTNPRRPDFGKSWPVDYVIRLAVPFPSLSLPLLLFYSPPSPSWSSFLVIYIFVKSMILSLSSSIPLHPPCLLFFLAFTHKENT
jgi:hypothetical protein